MLHEYKSWLQCIIRKSDIVNGEYTMNENLLRLLEALESLGFKKHGRATALHKLTGYAVSTISDVLKGSSELSERFTKIVCSSTGIRYEWVITGDGDRFTINHDQRHKDRLHNSIETSGLLEDIEAMTLDEVEKLIIKKMKTKGKAYQYRWLADIEAEEEAELKNNSAHSISGG